MERGVLYSSTFLVGMVLAVTPHENHEVMIWRDTVLPYGMEGGLSDTAWKAKRKCIVTRNTNSGLDHWYRFQTWGEDGICMRSDRSDGKQ